MWNRACPLCFSRVPRGIVLGKSESLVCPSCKTPLQLSNISRVAGVSFGLIVAFVVVHFLLKLNIPGEWLWPAVAAVFAYGIGCTVALAFFADLVVRSDREHSPQEEK
jgi:hypothetical protein